MRTISLKLVCLIGCVLSFRPLTAQKDSSSPQQVWPQLKVYYRINEKFRLYGLASGTKANSSYQDGTLGIFVDYFAKPWLKKRINTTDINRSSIGYYWWFRIGYTYSVAPPNAKKRDVNTLV